jgi:hypothetical protein
MNACVRLNRSREAAGVNRNLIVPKRSGAREHLRDA